MLYSSFAIYETIFCILFTSFIKAFLSLLGYLLVIQLVWNSNNNEMLYWRTIL